MMRVFRILSAHSVRLLVASSIGLGLTATSVSALTIDDTFLSSINDNPNASAYETAIEQASKTIAALFSNPITVNILFGYNASVLGQSQTGLYESSYNSYAGLLSSNSTANPANTILSTAVANLANGNGGVGLPVYSTPANLRALGVSTATGLTSSGGQMYDGVVTVGNLNFASGPGHPSQAVSVIENEIDNVLGGGASGSTLGTSNQGTGFGPLDLYRYQSTGLTIADVDSTPSYSTSPSAVSAFSVNGGATAIAQFNQAGGGSAYGDFGETPCLIQSAFYCGSGELFTTASPEYQMLESIGYDPLVATPLPSTWTMLIAGFVGLGFFAYRGTKKNAAAIVA
jgi:hypothetical protein